MSWFLTCADGDGEHSAQDGPLFRDIDNFLKLRILRKFLSDEKKGERGERERERERESGSEQPRIGT